MKVSVDTAVLSDAVARARRACPGSRAVTITNMIRLEADSEGLELRANNFASEYRERIQTDVSEPGALCVDGQKLAAISGGDTINLHRDGNQLAATCGRARYRLDTLPVADWPQGGECATEPIEIDAQAFANLLKRVQPAVSTNELDRALTGIILSCKDGQLVAAASNRAIMFRAAMPIAESIDSIVLPANAVTPIATTLQDVEMAKIAVHDAKLFVFAPTRSLRLRLLDFDVIDCDQLIPDDETEVTRVKASDLRAALTRIELFGEEAKGNYRGSFIGLRSHGNGLELVARDAVGKGAGTATDWIEATGPQWEGGFNARYLRALIEASRVEEIEVHHTPKRTIMIKGDGFIGLQQYIQFNFPALSEAA